MSSFDTKEISDIRIEDPLNFLTAAEKEEYLRARDDKRLQARREKLSRTQELQRLEEERIALERKRSADLKRRRAAKTAQQRRRMEAQKQARLKEERMERIVRIASIVTGSLILLLLLWIGVSVVRGYMTDRAEDEQIAADADGSVIADEDDTPLGAEIAGFTAMNDTVVTTTDLRLRSTPDSSADGNIVTTAVKGTSLKRTGINESIGWSRVDYNGQTLYCSSKYLTSR